MSIRLAPLSSADPMAVETLLDIAFGSDRHARTAYRLREGMTAIAPLSFVAYDGDALVGSLQSWPIALRSDAQDVPLTLVGPIAVHPGRQGEGIGRQLTQAIVDEACDLPLVMIGDPEYYGRFFGFSADATGGWRVPGPVDPRRLLARNAGGLPAHGTLGPRLFAKAGARV